MLMQSINVLPKANNIPKEDVVLHIGLATNADAYNKTTSAKSKVDKIIAKNPKDSIHLHHHDNAGEFENLLNQNRFEEYAAGEFEQENPLGYHNPLSNKNSSRPVDTWFNCGNIKDIKIKGILGNGVTKVAYLGSYHELPVVVKMITDKVTDYVECVRHSKSRDRERAKSMCFTFPNMKLMKEILLHTQLNHTNILKLLGYCVRSEVMRSVSVVDHGVIGVYEYASGFFDFNIRIWKLDNRLRVAYQLADLLDYLQNSPLGSLKISDFKFGHFLMKGGVLKLIDLDDITSEEPSCSGLAKTFNERREGKVINDCDFDLKCVKKKCHGYNARNNYVHATKMYFRILLKGTEAPLVDIRNSLENLTTQELKQMINATFDVLHIKRNNFVATNQFDIEKME
jgi:hypothetical protein